MTSAMLEHRADRLRRQLADALVADGAVSSPRLKAAFAEVPRHLFVPMFYKQSPTEQRAIDVAVPDEWLEGVYRDELLVIRPDARSSSTAPSLMAIMLEALDIKDDHRLLEIGTGSGYNAALLSHRLGAQNVVTVDIDPDLVRDARDRLASISYHPTLGLGDGAVGWPQGAPFDRLIATCAVEAVPTAWLDQVRPGGIIVAPIATGLAVLEVEDSEAASGHFLPGPAYFMPLRPQLRPADVSAIIEAVTSTGELGRPTELTPDIWFDGEFRFVLAAEVPGLRFLTRLTGGPSIFTHADGSWASVGDGTAVEGGGQRLWNAVERAHTTWTAVGCPTRDRFRLMIQARTQQISLDDGSHTWDLPHVD